MEHADRQARPVLQRLYQARRARHALAERLRDGPAGFGTLLGTAGAGVAALSRYLHRRFRPRPLDVREQLPGRQGDVQLCEFVERVQARRRELFAGREERDVSQYRTEILSFVVADTEGE